MVSPHVTGERSRAWCQTDLFRPSSNADESRQSVTRLEQKLDRIQSLDPEVIERMEEFASITIANRKASSMLRQSYSSSSDLASTKKRQNSLVLSKLERPRLSTNITSGLDLEIEKGLFSSWVYLRADARVLSSPADASSSSRPSIGYSFLTDISLAHISNISVLSLPIACNDLWRPDQYGYLSTSDRLMVHRSSLSSIQSDLGSLLIKRSVSKPLGRKALTFRPPFEWKGPASFAKGAEATLSPNSSDDLRYQELARKSSETRIILLGWCH